LLLTELSARTVPSVPTQELVSRGVTDPARVSVGGHSYGAFMAANLVAHCPQLFAAAIARSGEWARPEIHSQAFCADVLGVFGWFAAKEGVAALVTVRCHHSGFL